MRTIETLTNTIGVDEQTRREESPSEAFAEELRERGYQQSADKITIMKPSLAAKLIRLGVGPLKALQIEKAHQALLRDIHVPIDLKIAAIEAQPGIIEGIAHLCCTKSVREMKALSHAVPAGAEIELFAASRLRQKERRGKKPEVI